MEPNLLDLKQVEAFFKEYGIGDPEPKLREWKDYIQDPKHATLFHSEDGRLQLQLKCLAIAVGVDPRTVRSWLNPEPLEWTRVNQLTRLRLFTVAAAVGMKPPREEKIGPEKGHHHAAHVALVVPQEIVSESYYVQVTNSLAHEAKERGYFLSIHQVADKDFDRWLNGIILKFAPDGILMLRISSTPDALKLLALYRKPVVLIHADRQQYQKPVLTNVVPDQSRIEQQLRDWLRKHFRPAEKGKIVLATMPEESEKGEFPQLPRVTLSIRNHRIQAVRQALQGYQTDWVTLDDYSFVQALRVWKKHQDAAVYVCLSDQIAVGLKHLLIAAGRPWKDRIVGFDGTPLALREGIPSFSQGLDQLGKYSMEKLCNFFIWDRKAKEDEWPPFSETFVPVELRENKSYSSES